MESVFLTPSPAHVDNVLTNSEQFRVLYVCSGVEPFLSVSHITKHPLPNSFPRLSLDLGATTEHWRIFIVNQ